MSGLCGMGAREGFVKKGFSDGEKYGIMIA